MVFLIFFFLSIFSIQESKASALLKESIQGGLRFARSSRHLPYRFDCFDLHTYKPKPPLFFSASYGGNWQDNTTSTQQLIKWAFGALGASLLAVNEVYAEGQDVEFEKMLVEGYQGLKKIEDQTKGKQVVFLMGPTGEGKSFITRRMTGESAESIKKSDAVLDQHVSQTLIPNVRCRGDFCFCDPPAFEDNGRGEKRALLASMLLRCVLKSGTDRQARLMLVISPRRIGLDRGRGLEGPFAREFFPLLDPSVFDERNGVLCVFNDRWGDQHPSSYYEKELAAILKQAEEASKTARSSWLGILSDDRSRREVIEARDFYVKGLRKISSNFIDFNEASPEALIEFLKKTQPFPLRLKDYGGHVGKLLEIYEEAQRLSDEDGELHKTIKIIEMENRAFDYWVKRQVFKECCEEIGVEIKRLEDSLRHLRVKRDALRCEKRSGIWNYEITEQRTRAFWGLPGLLTRTKREAKKEDSKPFRTPVCVWVNSECHFISEDTPPEKIPHGLRSMRLDPNKGEFYLEYKGARGEDDNVFIKLELAESEPGVLLLHAENLKKVNREIVFLEQMLERSKRFLELMNTNDEGKIKKRREDNSKKLKELETDKALKKKYYEDRRTIFEATDGLLNRLFQEPLSGISKNSVK